MLNRTLSLAFAILMTAAVALSGAEALASERDRNRDRGRDQGRERVVDERAISLDEAVARAERRYQARAVRAEEKRQGDRIVYRIRLLGADGRVFEIRVDAASGRER